MEGNPGISRGPSHSSERPRRKHRAPSPLERPMQGPHLREWTEEGSAGHREPSGGGGPNRAGAAGAPWGSGAHQRGPARAHQAPQRPAEGRLAASADRHLGAPRGRGAVIQRGQHPPAHRDDPPPGATGQEEPSAGIPQAPRHALARQSSPPPLCPQGPGGQLSPRGVKNGGKESERRSCHKSQPPAEGAARNPEKERKRKRSANSRSHGQGQRPHGLDAREGPAGLLPTVRGEAGSNPEAPEGKGRTPHWGRNPAGPPPEPEGEESHPPTMPFEAYLTYDQPPARKKRKSGKTRATALHPKSRGKEDTTGAKAEAGESQKPPPPSAAGAPLPGPPPAPAPAPAAWPVLPDLGPCQPSDPPLPAFPSSSPFPPKPRALPSPRQEEGAGLPGTRLSSRTQVLSGHKRARRRRMLTLLQQCIHTLQNNVYLLSQARGVPCSLLQPVVQRDAPERLPGLEEHHGALAAETEPLREDHGQRASEKDTRQEHKSLREPPEHQVEEQVLHISATRPEGPPAKVAFSDSSETGGAAAFQEKVLPAPSPKTGTPAAPSHPASGHSGHPIPGKQVPSSQKKPGKKIAPLMAKSIRDYKNRYYRR